MNTENTLNRAYAHWLNDGLLEIKIGILLAGVGALRAIIHFAEEKSPSYYWLLAGLLIFMILASGGGSLVFKRIKVRITYPRTGYTAFKPYPNKNKIIFVVFIFAIILGGFLGVLSTQPDEQTIGIFVPIGQGIVSAMIIVYAAQRTEAKRLYYLAAFSIGIGLVIGAFRVGVVLGLSFFYLSMGLALVVTGSVALAQYLRNHESIDLNGESE